MTGFRIAYGGAQQHFGVTPDVTTLGKVRSPPRGPPTAKPLLRRHTPQRAPRCAPECRRLGSAGPLCFPATATRARARDADRRGGGRR